MSPAFLQALAAFTELGSAAAAVICVLAFLKYASADRQRTMQTLWELQKKGDERDDRLFTIVFEAMKQEAACIKEVSGEIAAMRESFGIRSVEIIGTTAQILELLAARSRRESHAADRHDAPPVSPAAAE